MSSKISQNNGLLSSLSCWWFDVCLIVACFGIAVAIWLPIRHLPFIDEAAVLIVDGTLTLTQRNFSPPILVEQQASHPPLFMILVGVVWQVFGSSRVVTHAIMVPFYTLFLYASYKLANRFVIAPIAVATTFLIGFMPVVVTEFQMVSVEIALASLVLLSLSFSIAKKWIPALVLLSLACLIKWTAILLLPSLIYWYWQDKKNNNGTIDYRWFLLPVATILIWYMYHNTQTGWWFFPPQLEVPKPTLHSVTNLSTYITMSILFYQGRWLLTLPAITASVWLFYRKQMNSEFVEVLVGLFLPVVLTGVFYSIAGNYADRRMVLILPLLIVGAVLILHKTLEYLLKSESSWITPLTLSFMVGVCIWLWKPNSAPVDSIQYRLPASLTYQDTIMVARLAAGFLQGGYTDTPIYGGLPEAYQFTVPEMGYVTQPLTLKYCNEFSLSQNQEAYVYVHPHDPSQIPCHQLKQSYTFEIVERFQHNTSWSELYRVTSASSSGTVQQVQPIE